MIYKINFSNAVQPQRGKKPSRFRTKVDRTLTIMEPGSSFTVWNKVGMTTTELANTLAAYASIYKNRNPEKKFSTKKYKHGVKVIRER
jgi:hypothetical protein